jgi:hypothetical protein
MVGSLHPHRSTMATTESPRDLPAAHARLLLGVVLCLVLCAPGIGCRKAGPPSREQQALERHQQEVSQVKQLRAYFNRPESGRTLKAVGFLEALGNNGQLVGLPKNEPQVLGFNLGRPVVSAKGPYYWSQEFQVSFKDDPPRHCHYVVVQTYKDGDFQLQRAWRTDDAGKTIEESALAPAPVMANPHQAFLGPANAGAERGWSGWFNGVTGGGSVAIGTNDPATGLNCFELGITNAVPGQKHHADIRSEMFSLGNPRRARGPFTFSFAYKLPTKVKPGDNIEVNFRFFDQSETNFLGQQTVAVGSSSGDSEMKQYQTKTLSGLVAPAGAAKADIWIVANVGGPWTSGTAQFDDLAVTAPAGRFWNATRIWLVLMAALVVLVIAGRLWVRDRKRPRLAPASGGQPGTPA